MTTYCLYHSVDLDGQASAAIVKSYVPDVVLIPFNYNVPFPYDRITPEDSVYFVDVAVQPYDEMLEIVKKVNNLTVIDHHITFVNSDAGKALKGILGRDFYCDTKLAGCELTWMYFNERSAGEIVPEIPRAIRLLGQYDTWRNTPEKKLIMDTSWETVMAFQWGMRQAEFDFDYFIKTFLHGFHSLAGASILSTIAAGESLLKYQDHQNTIAMLSSFTAYIKGYKCLCVNSSLRNSQVFASKWDENEYDFMVPFSMTKDQKWSWSFYASRPDKDASELAKQFGGGGHKAASGCFSTELIFDTEEKICG